MIKGNQDADPPNLANFSERIEEEIEEVHTQEESITERSHKSEKTIYAEVPLHMVEIYQKIMPFVMLVEDLGKQFLFDAWGALESPPATFIYSKNTVHIQKIEIKVKTLFVSINRFHSRFAFNTWSSKVNQYHRKFKVAKFILRRILLTHKRLN